MPTDPTFSALVSAWVVGGRGLLETEHERSWEHSLRGKAYLEPSAGTKDSAVGSSGVRLPWDTEGMMKGEVPTT